MKARIIRITVFLILVILTLSQLNYLLNPAKQFRSFYSQDKDTIDVLCVGSSATYANINPAVLWEKSGIAAYDFCGSGQRPFNTYFYLKEAFKTQHPKLVIYDIYTMVSPEEYQTLDEAAVNLSGFNIFSENKSDAAKVSVEPENYLNLMLGFPIYHKNYTTLINDPRKFLKIENFGSTEKGFESVNSWAYFANEIQVDDGYTDIPSKNLEYLNKIIELTRNNGAELLLLKTPYYLSEYHDQVYNSVEKIAQENNIGFLNMNKIREELKFNYSYELCDVCHLNNLGSRKVSEYLAEYITNNYDIPDRRGNEDFSSWEDYAQLFNRTQFKCPDGLSEKLVFNYNVPFAGTHTDSNLQNYFPFEIKDNCYYKIKISVSTDEDIYILLDFWGDGYYGNKQSDCLYAEKGDNRELVSYLYSGKVSSSETYFRLLGSYDNNLQFNSIEIYELYKD